MTSANPLADGHICDTRDGRHPWPADRVTRRQRAEATGLISAMAAAEHGCVDWYPYPLPVTVSNAQIQRPIRKS